MERPVGDGRILVRDVAVQRLDGKEQRVLKSRGGQFVNGWGIVEQGGKEDAGNGQGWIEHEITERIEDTAKNEGMGRPQIGSGLRQDGPKR